MIGVTCQPKLHDFFSDNLNGYFKGYKFEIETMVLGPVYSTSSDHLLTLSNNTAYPFVEKKCKYVGREGLAPELHYQLKYTPATFRHSNKMISKNVIEA